MIPTTPTAGTESEIFSVSELTRLIKQDLEETFPALWVRGEVSNFAHHRSGHMYFSLKDEAAVIRCVMFRQYNRYLREVPADGQQVLVRGKLTVYDRAGQYQILVVHLQSVGVGMLAARFEELKQKLCTEGLFEPARKRILPSFVTTVGVVSSPDGAAIRDIVQVATGWWTMGGRRSSSSVGVAVPSKICGRSMRRRWRGQSTCVPSLWCPLWAMR
jgi:exodeoxyribonuclease VII large subunit